MRIPKHQPVVLRVTLTFRRSQEACEKLMVWSSRIEKKLATPLQHLEMSLRKWAWALELDACAYHIVVETSEVPTFVVDPHGLFHRHLGMPNGYSVQIRYRIIYQMSCYDPCPLTLRKLAAMVPTANRSKGICHIGLSEMEKGLRISKQPETPTSGWWFEPLANE